jgi:WD40 repeat protein
MNSSNMQLVLDYMQFIDDELIIMDSNKLQEIFNNKEFIDVELIIKDSKDSFEKFHAHKIILTCSLDYYYNLFIIDNTNKSKFEVVIDDTKFYHDLIIPYHKLKLEPYKLRHVLYDEEFTDVELIIVDPNEKLNIFVHKVILACSSDYFYNLFTFGDGKNKSTFEIIVDDAKVSCDIIFSFYGIKTNSTDYPDWKYLLKTFINKNFFCLPNDVYLLYDLIVPPIGFDLLLDTIELFDFAGDAELIKTIQNNFPDDYDLNELSIDFIKEIIKVHNYNIVSGGDDNKIKIWDAKTGVLLNTLKGHTAEINSVAVSPNNLKIISGSDDDNGIKIWNATNGKILCTSIKSTNYSQYVNSVAFSSDNLKIVSGSSDHSIKIWDANTCDLINSLIGHKDWVNSVAFSFDNLKIVSGSDDRRIKIWDAELGCLLHTLKGHTKSINSVAFSPNNLKIVSGSDDFSIKIWDVESGNLINTLADAHIGSVNSVAFSPDNLKIVSGSADHSIKIWDAVTFNILHTLKEHTESVNCVAFSPDNLKIVSGSDDFSIKIWDAISGGPYEQPKFGSYRDGILHIFKKYISKKNTLKHSGPVNSVAFQRIFTNLDKRLINYLDNHQSAGSENNNYS